MPGGREPSGWQFEDASQRKTNLLAVSLAPRAHLGTPVYAPQPQSYVLEHTAALGRVLACGSTLLTLLRGRACRFCCHPHPGPSRLQRPAGHYDTCPYGRRKAGGEKTYPCAPSQHPPHPPTLNPLLLFWAGVQWCQCKVSPDVGDMPSEVTETMLSFYRQGN